MPQQIRVITYDPTVPEHGTHFRYHYEGFVMGGNALRNTPDARGRAPEPDFAARRIEARIVRKFKAVSHESQLPTGQVERMPGGSPMRVLDGGQLVLTEEEHAFILRCVHISPWNVAHMDEAEDAVDFWTAAPISHE